MNKIGLILCMLILLPTFYGFVPVGASIISIDQVNVEDGSVSSEGKVSNGYWVLTFSVDSNELVSGEKSVITFPTGLKDVLFGGRQLTTKKTIEISLTAKQGLLVRDIVKKNVLVVPQTYGGQLDEGDVDGSAIELTPRLDISAPALTASYYTWGSSSWNTHTPFGISIKQGGEQIYTGQIDTMGSEKGDFTVRTNVGNIIIHNLGQLASAYSSPEASDNIIFNRDYVYTGTSNFMSRVAYDTGLTFKDGYQIRKPTVISALYIVPYSFANNGGEAIKYTTDQSDAYSQYWYGSTRWDSDAVSGLTNTPAPYTSYTSTQVIADGISWKLTGSKPGWSTGATSQTVTGVPVSPISPVIFPSDKTGANMEYKSLIEYIESKGMVNQADSFLSGRYFGEWFINNDEINIPITGSAYASSVVQIFIPYELADTWAYAPASPSKIAITGSGWGSDTSTAVIGEGVKTNFFCDVEQTGDETGEAIIIASSDNSKFRILSPEMKISLAKGETDRVWFKGENLGDSSSSNGNISFKSQSTFGGTVFDSETDALSYVLLQKIQPMINIFDVLVRDSNTTEPVSGIQLSCFYGEKGQQSTVTPKNGVVTFNVGSALVTNIVFKGGEGILGGKTVKFEPQIITFNVNKPLLVIDLVAIPEVVIPPVIPPVVPPVVPPVAPPVIPPPVIDPPPIVEEPEEPEEEEPIVVPTVPPVIVVSQTVPWLLIISGATICVVMICITAILLFRMRKPTPQTYLMPATVAKYRIIKEDNNAREL